LNNLSSQNHSKIISYIVFASIITICTSLICTISADTNAASEPIKLGVKVWAPDFFSYLAQEKGFFEKNKVKVELKLVQDYRQILNNYINGDFDGMIPVYSDLIYQNSQGVDSRVVYAVDLSNTGDVIIGNVNNTINDSTNNATLADVKGKKISVEGINSFSHLFVLKALEKVGLGEGDIGIASVPAQNVTRELEKGTIVAGHIYQPYTTEALKKGYKILFAAGTIPGVITDVLVFRSDIIQQRPQEIQGIIKSIIEAQTYYENNKEESLKIMSNRSGIGEQEIKNGLESVTLVSIKENVFDLMDSKSNKPTSLYSSGKYISEFFLDRGQMDGYPDFSQIVDSDFVNYLLCNHDMLTEIHCSR
jgi:NitT/TauT family transport system substrate-binding protein